jgi:branched-subunit amino acid transport protein
VIIAATAGVVLPKILPALALPESIPERVAGWLEFLPAAILGAFTALTVTGYVAPSAQPWLVIGGLLLAGIVVLVTRRTLLALLAGWAVIVALHAGRAI